MKNSFLLLILIANSIISFGQEITFEKVVLSNTNGLNYQMKSLADDLSNQKLTPRDLYRAKIISGKYKEAITIIDSLYNTSSVAGKLYLDLYKFYANAKSSKNFRTNFKKRYEKYLKNSNDIEVIELDLEMVVRNRSEQYVLNFKNSYLKIKTGKIPIETAVELVNTYYFKTVFSSTKKLIADEINEDHHRRYEIDDSIIIPTKDGTEISGVLVKRKGNSKKKEATLLAYSIYAEESPIWAMLCATKGYVGMIANSRGKRKSNSQISPFEYENIDVNQVIDWISKQKWSNKKVGMYGGS